VLVTVLATTISKPLSALSIQSAIDFSKVATLPMFLAISSHPTKNRSITNNCTGWFNWARVNNNKSITIYFNLIALLNFHLSREDSALIAKLDKLTIYIARLDFSHQAF